MNSKPCVRLVLLNRVPALIGWGKGGNVTSSRSAGTAITPFTLLYLVKQEAFEKRWAHSPLRAAARAIHPVSYTHLTLPTIYSV